FSYGASAFAVGDVNGDTYQDFAVSRTREDMEAASGTLFVFYGGTSYSTPDSTPDRLLDENASMTSTAAFMIRGTIPADLGMTVSLVQELSVTGGDFDHDGLGDLAIGVPASQII